MKSFLEINDNPKVRSIKGPPGPPGENGLSAYEIAVLNGFIGSEDLWVQSLKGDQGEQGIQGIQGLKGDKGDQGLKGDKGDQGLKGDTGLQGAKGDKGLKGDKGDTGNPGRDGTTTNTNDNTQVKMWIGTQAEYDLIPTKDSETLYMIKGA